MKKLFRIICIASLCLALVGCDTEYAKEEYYMDAKIASRADHYNAMAKHQSKYTHSATYKAKKFDGNVEIYESAILKEGIMNITCSLSLDSGAAKLVYVDNYDSVTTLVEITPETPIIESVQVPVNVELGRCRIKLVGYDCVNVAAEIEWDD